MQDQKITEISLNDIMPNRFQPREIFNEQALNELALSIREHGVIQPITVRRVGDKYEIIAGERRYRASKIAGKTTIPAMIREIEDKEAAKIALLENLQRQDLNPIEEAKTYQTILKLENLTQEELADNLGKAQSTVANKLRLLNLDEEVQTALLNNKISERHARSFLNVKDKSEQKRLLEKIILNRMTVKQLDEEIALLNKEPDKSLPKEEKKDKEIKEDKKDEIIPHNTNIFDQLRVGEKPNKPEEPDILEPIQAEADPVIEEPQKEITEPLVKEENIEKEELQEETPQEEPTEQINQNYNIDTTNNVYDLRFAINNVRQVIQNTKKFGFNIDIEEFDFENIYQIIIKIDKNKQS